MYPPSAQRKDDPAFIRQLILEHPFAALISNGDSLLCSHIPVLINESEDRLVLFGHLANLNQQCTTLKADNKAMLVFRGPQSYISASWYQQKGRISTWDYSAVHIWVTCIEQDQDELLHSLKTLNHRFEGNDNAFNDIDPNRLHHNLRHITGFNFYPDKVESIAKWHQEDARDDVRSVIQHLSKQEDPNPAQMLAKELAQEHDLDDSF